MCQWGRGAGADAGAPGHSPLPFPAGKFTLSSPPAQDEHWGGDQEHCPAETASRHIPGNVTLLPPPFIPSAFLTVIGKSTAGASQTIPTSISTSIPWMSSAGSCSRPHLQPLEPPAPFPEQGNGKASTPGVEPLEGLPEIPHSQQPPAPGTAAGKAVRRIFHGRRRWGRWEGASLGFFPAFSPKVSLIIPLAGSVPEFCSAS